MEASKEQELIAMFKKGMTPTAIATELEISISNVRAVLKRHSLTVEDVAPSATQLTVGQAYAAGVPVPELLQKYGLTYSKLYTLLNKQEIPLRRTENTLGKTSMMEKAIDMYRSGIPLWKIREETGVAQPQLHTRLHELGVALRRPRK